MGKAMLAAAYDGNGGTALRCRAELTRGLQPKKVSIADNPHPAVASIAPRTYSITSCSYNYGLVDSWESYTSPAEGSQTLACFPEEC